MTLSDADILDHANLEQLERYIELREWEKIELAERTASAKQLAAQRAFFTRADETGRKCSRFVFIGGNRSGKTFTGVRLCASKYIRDVARHGDLFWFGSPNLDKSVSGVQQELWNALPAGMFLGRTWDSKVGFGGHATVKIRTRDGGHCTIKFRSADQDMTTFESDKLRGILWDENLPEPLYNRLLPRLIDLNGWLVYCDINNQAWPIERLEEAPADAGVYYQNFTMYDNEPNLPSGAIDEFKAGLPEDEIRLRVLGQPGAMEGVVFKQFRDYGQANAHAIDDYPNGVPAGWPRWRIIDFGETAPTACSWATVSPTEAIVVYREHYQKGKSVFGNAKLIHEASGAKWREVQRGKDDIHDKPWTQLIVTGGEKYACNYLDPACFGENNGSRVTVAQEYADAGITCRPWPRVNIMGEHAMVARFKYRLEKGTWFVFKSCTNMRREMRIWKHDLDKDGRPKAADAYEHANNHLIDGQKGFIATNPTYAQPTVHVFGKKGGVEPATPVAGGRKRYYQEED
jgi:hypothetical protein